MDRDEQVGIRFVGYVRTGLQGNEHIGRTGIYHFDIGVALCDELTHLEHKREVQIFLLGEFPDSSGILTSMTCVKHNSIWLLCPHRPAHQQCHYYIETFLHTTPNLKIGCKFTTKIAHMQIKKDFFVKNRMNSIILSDMSMWELAHKHAHGG